MSVVNDRILPANASRRRLRRRAFLVAVAAAAAWPAYHLFWRHHVKRFQVVREGVFYRVAQPSELGLRYLVDRRGVRTIVSLRLEDDRLRSGLIDLGDADGELESRFVESLGVRHLQWPMGREACWPWLTPWQFEEYFKLLDDPANWPVAVHCVGGRHRTGTLSALFRLEYDRWPVERVLAEMYSFQFGPPVPLQEFNLRTYVPRPRPSEPRWRTLAERWNHVLESQAPTNYEELIQLIRTRRGDESVERRLAEDLRARLPFALPIAQRVIERTDDGLATIATLEASKCLGDDRGEVDDWMAAAALVADFGSAAEQDELRAALANEPRATPPSARYDAIVAGISNRYTPNRLGFLRVLLDDERPMLRPEARCRYCDLAVVRIAAIVDQRFLSNNPAPCAADWDKGRSLATSWFASHPDAGRLSRLLAPTGHTVLEAGNGRADDMRGELRR